MEIFVCVGSACHVRGSYNIMNQLQQMVDENELDGEVFIKAALCLGNCANAVSVKVDDDEPVSLSNENVRSFFEKHVLERLGKQSR